MPKSKKLKIAVIGYARHGKDTVAEILSEQFGYKFNSSSRFANELCVYPVLKEKYGYKTPDECYEDRVNHRAEWHQLIADYCAVDKSCLTREILEVNDIYVGIRCDKEFEASKKLFDLIIWVEATERIGEIEPYESMKLNKSHADIIIDNNGTEDDLFTRTISLGFALK